MSLLHSSTENHTSTTAVFHHHTSILYSTGILQAAGHLQHHEGFTTQITDTHNAHPPSPPPHPPFPGQHTAKGQFGWEEGWYQMTPLLIYLTQSSSPLMISSF